MLESADPGTDVSQSPVLQSERSENVALT